jgi:flavin reductase (DIM6/NTAB) family NADH-FMN oxidoreductase RutF
MIIDPAALTTAELHRFMIGVVIPRPIAFVSSLSKHGKRNLAPFSFFNAIASKPPLLSVSINDRGGAQKDTLRNIRETEDFVINIVNEPLLAPMVHTSGDWLPDVDEFELAGLTAVASEKVKAPRLGEAPVSMECVLERIIELEGNNLVIGRLVWAHAKDELFVDGRVDPTRLLAVGRLGGIDYTVVREIIRMARPKVPPTGS